MESTDRSEPRDSLASEQLKPVARASLSDKIVEQLIDLISRDVLKPGDRLPSERELCKRFGVGRDVAARGPEIAVRHGNSGWKSGRGDLCQ